MRSCHQTASDLHAWRCWRRLPPNGVAMISRGLLHLESASDDRAAEPPPPPLPVREAAIGARVVPWHEFDDSAGVSWRVFELPAGSAGHSSWGASLIFESDTEVRRARNFPLRWPSLSALELERISRER